MTTEGTHPITANEFLRLNLDHVELINGHIYDRAAPTRAHADAVLVILDKVKAH